MHNCTTLLSAPVALRPVPVQISTDLDGKSERHLAPSHGLRPQMRRSNGELQRALQYDTFSLFRPSHRLKADKLIREKYDALLTRCPLSLMWGAELRWVVASRLLWRCRHRHHCTPFGGSYRGRLEHPHSFSSRVCEDEGDC
jgi:hypothetical protein